jgi:hypothetical protein
MEPTAHFNSATGQYTVTVLMDGIEFSGSGRSPYAAEKICRLHVQEHERQQRILRLNQKFLESERRASEQFASARHICT